VTGNRRRRVRLACLAVAMGLGASACGTAPATVAASPPSTDDTTTTTTTTTTTVAPSTTTLAPASRPPIRIGPGSLAAYAVQAQPAPGSCHYTYVGPDPLPDPSCTPGAVNPVVTQADIATTICRSGWTAGIRPPPGITGVEKAGSARAYGYTGSFATGEYDHLIPLELGGDPNDPANLWLEPNENPDAGSTHNAKDDLENTLRGLVCSGSMTLAAAQLAIATDWVTASRQV
jgi:hypothetical protein